MSNECKKKQMEWNGLEEEMKIEKVGNGNY
jgi:hypothetical protein